MTAARSGWTVSRREGEKVPKMTSAKIRKFLARAKLPLLLAALLVVFAFALEFHHHDDGADHPDCSFCGAIHQAQSASIQHQETGLPVIAHALLALPSEQPDPVSRHLAVPVIRPPPA
jgi:hypothetical protein